MLSNFYSLLLIICIFSLIYIINYAYLYFYKNKDFSSLKNNIMGSILILFGILKLYDIEKFMEIFQKYDIISKNIPLYSLIYPFIEILLGLYFLYSDKLTNVKLVTNFLMFISIISVSLSMIKGQTLRCGCLGAFFHIPLSYVTMSENIIMLLINNL